MKILIATGIYPPDIGGPARYAREVELAFREFGYEVKTIVFGSLRGLPTGLRHLYYFCKVLFSLKGVDFVFSPDTFSAVLPALLACRLRKKRIILRTGGDFLWEQYVERSGDTVLLRDFYNTRICRLNIKEKIIFYLIRFIFKYSDAIIFSTKWQQSIFEKPYGLNLNKCFLIENYYGARQADKIGQYQKGEKIFVGGTRKLKWKNLARVKEAFFRLQKEGAQISLALEVGTRDKFLADMRACYAVIIASLGDISPNTILEAIQFGKPFILTRETGLYDKLRDIGVWVNPEDIDDITRKIRWLSSENNYRSQIEKIMSFEFTHSWNEIAKEILDIYQRIK